MHSSIPHISLLPRKSNSSTTPSNSHQNLSLKHDRANWKTMDGTKTEAKTSVPRVPVVLRSSSRNSVSQHQIVNCTGVYHERLRDEANFCGRSAAIFLICLPQSSAAKESLTMSLFGYPQFRKLVRHFRFQSKCQVRFESNDST